MSNGYAYKRSHKPQHCRPERELAKFIVNVQIRLNAKFMRFNDSQMRIYAENKTLNGGFFTHQKLTGSTDAAKNSLVISHRRQK